MPLLDFISRQPENNPPADQSQPILNMTNSPYHSPKVRSGFFAFNAIVLLATILTLLPQATHALEVKDGQRIVLLGNTLAERMQHHGWLETYAQLSMPEKKLSFRNHGFCGDKIDNRPRNRGFIDPHKYLEISQADVILTFFGANEAWDNNPSDYGTKLGKWVDETLTKKYNGQSAPVIVLFSPIAHENLNSPDFPDGKKQNEKLKKIAEATAKVAKEKKLEYVDLFAASQKLYQENQSSGGSRGDPSNSHSPLTINGIHLSSNGNDLLSRVIHKALFGKDAPVKHAHVKQTKEAILNKNWHWFNRYRATDGNDVWGGRSGLRFANKQSNKDVLWHELSMIDVMTANRDKVVHAAAKGKTIVADDSNVPAPIKVPTHLKANPGGKEGSRTYLPAEKTVAQLKLADGLEANVFASEEQFPEIANPVQMAVDTKGRLWVAAWPTYPKWEPLKDMEDALVILPDENRDGVADKAITFAKVHNPTGFEFWNGGVIVASAPDLIFLKDTDGDDVADVRIRIMHGIDSADTHHTANNLIFGPDGHIYYQRGVFHVSNVETPWQGPQKHGNSAMYRFNPRTSEYAFHANNSPNPHGITFDYWGYHYATDGTGGRAYQVRPDGKGGFKMQGLLKKTVRPVPSCGVLSSAHFPEKNNGNFLICNSIGFLGIKQYTLADDGNGNRQGTAVDDLLVSPKDRNFRPTDIEIGDDGALYVSDWQNVIIGHMQFNVRDPNRNKTHGRVYRITAKGRPLMKHVKIDGEPIATLLNHLKNPTNIIRHRARIELSERDTDDVIKETQKWLKQFDPKNKAHAHHLLEALWIHQQHNVVNKKLLDQVLGSPENHAKIAAKTVEQFWAKKL
jgi:glucose/arabinose dehydrogenase/lysophospholipase L1-like esterase